MGLGVGGIKAKPITSVVLQHIIIQKAFKKL